MIRLRAAPKPRCRLGPTKRTLGSWMLLKIELLSSVDPSSTTTSSQSDQVWAKMLRRQSRRNGPALYTGSPMVKVGDGMRGGRENWGIVYRSSLCGQRELREASPPRSNFLPQGHAPAAGPDVISSEPTRRYSTRCRASNSNNSSTGQENADPRHSLRFP